MNRLPMCADFGFPLTLANVQSASATVLLASLKAWLARENPVCLMHPHGFYVVLLDWSETAEWRFHIWPKGSKTIVGMPAFIHTHDRHVESRVLQGRLTNIIYDVSEVSIGGCPLYEVRYDGDRYVSKTPNSLHRTKKRVVSVRRHQATVGTGGVYRVDRHVYHEAVVREQLTTATLVCMHCRSPGSVKVVGLDGYPETITFVRAEHRVEEFVGLMAA